MIKKVITNQDAFYKWVEKNSGETSINLSTEIANLLVPDIEEDKQYPITFKIYKCDFIRALGAISNVLPLYRSTSKSSIAVPYTDNWYNKNYNIINKYFSNNVDAYYTVNLLARKDGRYYLNDLDKNGFNIRQFLVSYYSVMEFKNDGTELTLRIETGPIRDKIESLTLEERKEAFFEYIDSHKNGATRANYKKATLDTQNINAGKPIVDNMANLGYPGTLLDMTDISKVSILHHSIVLDPTNSLWNQTCSATVGTYRDFLISLHESHKVNIGVEQVLPPSPINEPLQQIYYGAPGTGKSFGTDGEIRKVYPTKEDEKGYVFRTTFHPDSDYSTFVGCYKPTKGEKLPIYGFDSLGNTRKAEDPKGTAVLKQEITYDFVAQSFTKAYIKAWFTLLRKETLADKDGKEFTKPIFLIIEEINRGNCAQIFGDLFQLLDRNEDGFSTYPIKPDTDLGQYIKEEFAKAGLSSSDYPTVVSGEELILPNNLYIWATMNTSDQSLFPVDSAFKRRWDWKYVPIDTEKENWAIEVNGKKYSWTSFLDIINEKIFDKTQSEDKQLGFYFCKAKDKVISAEKFVGKVLFYLYNDVFKDYGFDEDFFKDEDSSTISFRKFYKGLDMICEEKVEKILMNLNVELYKEGKEEEDGGSEVEEDETTAETFPGEE